MALSLRLMSKFRSKKDKVGRKDGDKTEIHHVPISSNSQSTTPSLPAVVESSQNPTIVSAQAHPSGVYEARDYLTESLRKGPFSDIHNPGQQLVKAQQALETSFGDLHDTWEKSAQYYEGASVGDDTIKQAVIMASNDSSTPAESYSKVIEKALLKNDAQQGNISSTTRVCMSKMFPVLRVVLGAVSFSADAASFLPLKITANALSQVVTLASNAQSSSVAVVEGLEELSDHQHFLNSVSSLNFELDNGTDSIVVKAINLLVAITDFLRISIQFLQKGFTQRIWDQVTSGDVNAAITSLKHARQNFAFAVSEVASMAILRRENDEATQKALQNMSPLTFKKTHDDVVRNRLEKSGRWLLDHPSFCKWLRGDILTLWCPGEGGAGKTVLTSTVVDHVDSYIKCQREIQPDKRIGFIYLYCRFQNHAEQTVLQFIPAIIRQLAAQDLSAVGRVKKFNENRPTKSATLIDYTTLLSELLDSFSAVYLMVDALDEFSKFEHERKDFVQELLSLNGTRTILRIFITSRPDHHISKEIRGDTVDIQASDADIHSYIERSIDKNSTLKSWVTQRPELRMKMLETIPNKARKIFQLAKLQMDYLVIEQTIEDVSDALDSLLGNVNDYYQKSIERIETMGSARDQTIIKTMLKWVYYARRPLRVDEMYHILAVKPGNKLATRLLNNVKSDMELGLETFIDGSAGLLTIRTKSQIVSVAHPTVQEYLQTLEATLLSDAEEEISRTCLTYLSLDVFANGYCTSYDSLDYRISEFRFIAYSSRFWGNHLRGKPEQNTALQDLALDFLKNKKLLSSSAQAKVVMRKSSELRLSLRRLRLLQGLMLWMTSSYPRRFSEISSVIVAARFGLISLVNRLLEDGAGVNERGESDETALHEASLMGHEPVVKILLDKGADINAQGGQYNSALVATSSKGHIGVVKLLLARGANVNAKGGKVLKSALHAASKMGYVQIVAMLLNEGAEVNADGESPLHGAAYRGDVAIVKMLLDKGARINARGSEYGTALRVASLKGNIEVVKLLLQNEVPKVEVNVEGGPEYDALLAASKEGHEATARLLIKNGADVNAHHVLHEASMGGYVAIVRLLLHNGADVNAQGGKFNTALQAAAFKGHEEIVKLLLHNGADVNAQGGKFNTALQAAAFKGHEEIVKLLLHNGADVNAQGGKFNTALQAAAFKGHEEIVKLLLYNGANVNAQGELSFTTLQATDVHIWEPYFISGNSLQAASCGGHEAIVRLLLKNGAEVNAPRAEPDYLHIYALQSASAYGGIDVVRLLLDEGADVNAEGGSDYNALWAAARWGHEGVVRLLLERGATVNWGEERWASLKTARRRVNDETLELIASHPRD
ncbi:hypothetical protein V491_00258 [Pseudogymnoascus sp. VKM F-3775]|nr:hypothetical protein V491_00258 [Pseudogymnoascus sp. VKM F-3775]